MALSAKATSGANPGSGSTTLSWTHTVGSGDDRCIWVGCYNPDSTDPTCTVDGNAATVVDSQVVAFDLPLRVWRYLMPAVGTVTIAISFGVTAFNRAGVAISYSGVDQTTPENDLNKFGATFDEQGVLIDATSPDNVTLSFTGARDPLLGTPDLTATGSAAFDEERINSNIVVALASATTAGTEVVHSSSTPMEVNWGMIGFSVNPSAGGGGDPDALARLIATPTIDGDPVSLGTGTRGRYLEISAGTYTGGELPVWVTLGASSYQVTSLPWRIYTEATEVSVTSTQP